MQPYFTSENFTLYNDNCIDVLRQIQDVDMVFADPPYFLSNNGLTIQNGEIVSVNKGDWDKLEGSIYEFNRNWISAVRKVLKPNGTIWISGTMHNIFSIYQVLNELGFKILNVITWRKLNPPPNFSCRTFTHSTELIIWARKSKNIAHYYNYELMKAINDGRQMKDVWDLPAIAKWEKTQGKHPTQKPLSVLSRIVLASTHENDLVLDPFTGSSTTGIAATLFNRKFIGIDTDAGYLEISKNRYKEAISLKIEMARKIQGLNWDVLAKNENIPDVIRPQD